jgi:Uma2 family endonuclease
VSGDAGTAAPAAERHGRLKDREQQAELTGLDEETLPVLYDEYGNRRAFEVIGGRLVEKPIMERSSHFHERRLLQLHLQAQNARNVVGGPCAVRLPDGELYAGDVVVWRPETVMVGEPDHTDGFHGVPDLFIEVVSTWKAAQDAEEKRRHCAACGVPHFWVVDLRTGNYLIYSRPEGDEYTQRETAPDRSSLTLPPDLR